MKQKKKSLWISMIALCLAVCALTFGYGWYSSLSETRDYDLKTDMKMEGIRLTLSNLAEAQAKATSDFEQQLKDNLKLLSLPLQSIVREEGDEAIQNYVYGCVLRKDANGFVLPADSASIPLLEAQEYADMPYTPPECSPFEDMEGFFWSYLENAPQEDELTAAVEAAAQSDAEDAGEDTAEASAEEAAENPEEGAAETSDSGADAASEPEADPEQEEETSENNYVLCAYRCLSGPYYYLYYTPISAVKGFFCLPFRFGRRDAERRNGL